MGCQHRKKERKKKLYYYTKERQVQTGKKVERKKETNKEKKDIKDEREIQRKTIKRGTVLQMAEQVATNSEFTSSSLRSGPF